MNVSQKSKLSMHIKIGKVESNILRSRFRKSIPFSLNIFQFEIETEVRDLSISIVTKIEHFNHFFRQNALLITQKLDFYHSKDAHELERMVKGRS